MKPAPPVTSTRCRFTTSSDAAVESCRDRAMPGRSLCGGGAADEFAQQRMDGLARQGADLRLEQRQHEEVVRGQLQYLDRSVVGSRLDDHAAGDEPIQLRRVRPVV